MKAQKSQTTLAPKTNSWKKQPAFVRSGIIFGGVTLILELIDFFILTMFCKGYGTGSYVFCVFPTRSLHLFHTYGDNLDFAFSWVIYILIGMIVGSVMNMKKEKASNNN